MFLDLKRKKVIYTRTSKNGITHEYYRFRSIATFRCDNCDFLFERNLKNVDRKRLSNNYFHVCSTCDAKRFAQKKGVEQKKIWDFTASSDLPVGKY